MVSRSRKPWFLGAIVPAVILLFWEVFVDIGVLNPFFVSSPVRIVLAAHDQLATAEFYRHFLASIVSYATGFGLAAVLGIFLALLIVRFKYIEYSLEPLLWFCYSAPLIALFPLFMIFLGPGYPTVITLTGLLGMIPITINTVTGFKNADRGLIRVARSFGAGPRDIFWKILLPNSLPFTVAGLRIGAGRALIGLVIGEMLASSLGLGARISYYGNKIRTSDLFVEVMVVLLLGLTVTQGLRFVERKLERHRD
ncbi:MAG TPA: ABC transporter permease [bacterium]|nr:ABC transporter permease [bacterium]